MKSCRAFFFYTLQLGRSACLEVQICSGCDSEIFSLFAKFSSEANAFLQSECEGNYPRASLRWAPRFKVPFRPWDSDLEAELGVSPAAVAAKSPGDS